MNASVPNGAPDAMRSPWIHERLLAYRTALEFYRLATTIRRGLPRGLGPLGDQLSRAAQSVCLNLAEGAASRSRAVKMRSWDIAAGSACECAAALDVVDVEDGAAAGLIAQARDRLRLTTLLITGLRR